MSFTERLKHLNERGHLCVGLDPTVADLPENVNPDRDGIERFLKDIIEATSPYAVAYKPNAAFYEALGPWGWEILESLRDMIPSGTLMIFDAKRGDVGHTAHAYAHAAFKRVGADAITLSPFLGEDSVRPFLEDPERGAFLLCLTSNPDAFRWQTAIIDGDPLFIHMARWAKSLNGRHNVGLVAGATRPEELAMIREQSGGDMPLLIPGVGAQQGDLRATLQAASGAPFLINASRSIVGASKGADYADAAALAASKLHSEIQAAEASVVGS